MLTGYRAFLVLRVQRTGPAFGIQAWGRRTWLLHGQGPRREGSKRRRRRRWWWWRRYILLPQRDSLLTRQRGGEKQRCIETTAGGWVGNGPFVLRSRGRNHAKGGRMPRTLVRRTIVYCVPGCQHHVETPAGVQGCPVFSLAPTRTGMPYPMPAPSCPPEHANRDGLVTSDGACLVFLRRLCYYCSGRQTVWASSTARGGGPCAGRLGSTRAPLKAERIASSSTALLVDGGL